LGGVSLGSEGLARERFSEGVIGERKEAERERGEIP